MWRSYAEPLPVVGRSKDLSTSVAREVRNITLPLQ
jgi:hypothetical protein